MPRSAARSRARAVLEAESPQYLEAVVAESLKLPARVWRLLFDECLVRADHPGAELGRIGAKALAAGIPMAMLKTCADAGHGLHREGPDLLATEVAAWIDTECRI